jgi:SAM-dependent methyltransferase
MTTTTAQAAEADRVLKARHQAMWALGDYPALADEIIPDLGRILAGACGVRPGDTVVYVAAGSGNAAIPAAQAGAQVVACDLTPEMLAAGQARAAAHGVQIEWRKADAEALPFATGQFGIVMSCLGVMFAPHHQASASELVRICRPGGTIGLLNWTPEGFIGQMFATMKPYTPPPPPGAQPPPLWGREDYVRALLGDQVTSITAQRQTLRVEAFTTPEEFCDYFKTHYGPVIAAYRSIAGDPARVTALDDALTSLARRHSHSTTATVMEWEYLLLTARKRVD